MLLTHQLYQPLLLGNLKLLLFEQIFGCNILLRFDLLSSVQAAWLEQLQSGSAFWAAMILGAAAVICCFFGHFVLLLLLLLCGGWRAGGG